MTQAICISIVDDDASVRQALCSLIRSIGHEARLFESGQAFIGSGAVADTAVLVTDVQMPGMSGIELQEHLRRIGHQLPVIFITAFPEDALRKRAYAGGAACFLTKPFEGDALIRCIEALVSNDTSRTANND